MNQQKRDLKEGSRYYCLKKLGIDTSAIIASADVLGLACGFGTLAAEVDIAYEQVTERAMQELEKIGRQWAEKHKDIVLEPPAVQGVMALGASGITIRRVIKVKAMTHWEAERELKPLIKNHFDAPGVEIPFNRQVVYLRKEES